MIKCIVFFSKIISEMYNNQAFVTYTLWMTIQIVNKCN